MKKILLITAGILCLLLGGIGVIIPVFPTTPFVLLAGLCFMYSSPELFVRIKRIPMLGAFITHYSEKTGVSRNTKIGVMLFMWTGLIISLRLNNLWWMPPIIIAVGVAVSLHIILLHPKASTEREVALQPEEEVSLLISEQSQEETGMEI